MIDDTPSHVQSGLWPHAEICPICKGRRNQWCATSPDSTLARCRFVSHGAFSEKTDSSGVPYWLHRLRDSDDYQARQHIIRPKIEPEATLADEQLHRVYHAFMRNLDLFPNHRDDLLRRGLTRQEIKQAGFRSLPLRGRAKAIHKMLARLNNDHATVLQTPGFYLAEGQIKVAGSPGLIIPVFNEHAQVVALSIRPDERKTDDSPKYIWLSSGHKGGPRCRSRMHVPLGVNLADTQTIRITEGTIKSIVATARSGILTLGCPGLGWRLALPILEAHKPDLALLGFDADHTQNWRVARVLVEAHQQLTTAGYRVAIELWPLAEHKGIDDRLAAGGAITRLEGDDAQRYLAGLTTSEVNSGSHGNKEGGGFTEQEIMELPSENRTSLSVSEFRLIQGIGEDLHKSKFRHGQTCPITDQEDTTVVSVGCEGDPFDLNVPPAEPPPPDYPHPDWNYGASLGLPVPPPAAACRRHFARAIESKKRAGQVLTTRYSCDNWKCRVCHQRKVFFWAVHILRCAQADVGTHRKLWVLLGVNLNNLEATQKRIERACGNWVTVDAPGGVNFLLSTPSSTFSADAIEFPEAVGELHCWLTHMPKRIMARDIPRTPYEARMSEWEYFEAFAEHLRADRASYRPVNPGGCWKLSLAEEEEASEWTMLGSVRCKSHEPVTAMLLQLQITRYRLVEARHNDGERAPVWLVEWMWPDDWSNRQRSKATAALLSLNDCSGMQVPPVSDDPNDLSYIDWFTRPPVDPLSPNQVAEILTPGE